jgi:hypothetical protein
MTWLKSDGVSTGIDSSDVGGTFFEFGIVTLL